MKAQKTIRYIGVVAYPILFGITAATIWSLLLRKNGINFSEEAETPFLYMIMPLTGFVYTIFASLAVSAAFDRYKQLMRSITRKDMASYLEFREQQLPGLMRILVAVPSLVLLFLVFMYKYADPDAGLAAVFLVTLTISQTWVVISELDTVHKRATFKANVPDHWHEHTADSFFTEASK